MQLREELLSKYPKISLEVDNNLPLKAGGNYERDEIDPDGYITITGNANYYVQNGILAEELGHHETSYGNILGAYNQSSLNHVANLKQELKARRHGYKLIVPLERLINCYKLGIWGNIFEMCLEMQIDPTYFEEVIKDYYVQFGKYVKYDGYYIQFKPLHIEKLG